MTQDPNGWAAQQQQQQRDQEQRAQWQAAEDRSREMRDHATAEAARWVQESIDRQRQDNYPTSAQFNPQGSDTPYSFDQPNYYQSYDASPSANFAGYSSSSSNDNMGLAWLMTFPITYAMYFWLTSYGFGKLAACGLCFLTFYFVGFVGGLASAPLAKQREATQREPTPPAPKRSPIARIALLILTAVFMASLYTIARRWIWHG